MHYVAAILLTLLTCGSAVAVHASESPYAARRAEMVAVIENDVRVTAGHTGLTHFDARVMQAMGRVPRHRFVPPDRADAAYENRPLPIGYGQTISQPYIVALMTELLGVGKDSVVLEIGTGSGYQAAVLAALADQVYSVEIVEPLHRQAGPRLAEVGYHNVTTRLGDGYYGWPEHAPFDAIVVTAAASHVPPPLIAQLRPGGRMVIPVGGRFMVQQLLLIEKNTDATLTTRQVLPVRFVPLTGDH
ncbi:MAG: protein-L-isoaspartate(D-aspartate) O-methyltransferase [Gammaproteobacteria bacterium]|nr:protein-L-isoaspartate(D-aspartate) O-methyltransferase [Gammaproteobacteria bacterium]